MLPEGRGADEVIEYRLILLRWMSPLVAQSGHSNDSERCLLSGGKPDIGGECPFLNLSRALDNGHRYSIEVRTLHSVRSHFNQELRSNGVTLTPNDSVSSLCAAETKNECAVRKICCGLDSHAAIRLLYDQAMLRCRARFSQNLPYVPSGAARGSTTIEGGWNNGVNSTKRAHAPLSNGPGI